MVSPQKSQVPLSCGSFRSPGVDTVMVTLSLRVLYHGKTGGSLTLHACPSEQDIFTGPEPPEASKIFTIEKGPVG